MKPALWINLGVPLLLLVLGLGTAISANYLSPKGDWVLAIFPAAVADPFLAVAPYAQATAGDAKQLNGVIAYVPDKTKRQALQQTSLLIDPLGVPLCRQ